MNRICILMMACWPALALGQMRVEMNAAGPGGPGKSIGSITVAETDGGVVFTPDLVGLPPGSHGFHVHENASCEAGEKEGRKTAALAAGGHFDPGHTGVHRGPEGGGHKGDLPRLEVSTDGSAKTPVVIKGMKLSGLMNHALVIHAGGDNYSDEPEPLGGGGARIACGVIAE